MALLITFIFLEDLPLVSVSRQSQGNEMKSISSILHATEPTKGIPWCYTFLEINFSVTVVTSLLEIFQKEANEFFRGLRRVSTELNRSNLMLYPWVYMLKTGIASQVERCYIYLEKSFMVKYNEPKSLKDSFICCARIFAISADWRLANGQFSIITYLQLIEEMACFSNTRSISALLYNCVFSRHFTFKKSKIRYRRRHW